MITIEQHLCKSMYRFVKEHLDEIKETPEILGFKSYKDMLTQIKTNMEVAYWAMTELCAWGMRESYDILFLCGEYDDYNVYGICKRYFKKPYHEDGIVEVKQVVKTVKVIDFEDVK